MRRKPNAAHTRLACALVAVGSWLDASSVLALPTRLADIPNGDKVNPPMVAAKCLFCHAMAPSTCPMDMLPCLSPEFGMPFKANGWGPALAALDNDGDGFTNGQELQDPTGAWRPAMPQPGIPGYVTLPYDMTQSPGLHDGDMDGVCWFGRDMNGDRVCTAANERSATDRDCDDMNEFRYSGAEELCDGGDQDCDGKNDEGLVDCDPGAGDCGAGQGENKQGECHPRERIDGDKDGICLVGTDMSDPPDWDCMDAAEQTTLRDCQDGDPQIKPGAQEACLDGVDNDCDMRTDATDSSCTDYVDDDGDGFCPKGEDLDMDGECDTEDEAASPLFDCTENNAAIAPGAEENCVNDEDDDCDGLEDGRDESCARYQDADGDGFCVEGVDRNDDGLCDARNEVGTTVDCDEGRPNVYPGAPENCIDGRDNDCDGDKDEAVVCTSERDEDDDGYCPLGRDRNGDGDCLDQDEDESVSDCRDNDDETNPDAIEDCKDLVDNDCDGEADLADDGCARLLDSDEDGYCEGGQDINGDHDCLDSDEESAFSDCLEGDPAVRPRAGERCDDGIDNDCNGQADGFDIECTCANDEMCPVDEPCLIGTCFVQVGVCLVLSDPACTMDGGADAGDASTGMERPDGSDAGGMDGGADAGEGDEQPPVLEDVGYGCGVVRGRTASDAWPLAFALGLAAALRLRKRVRSRRSAFIPDRS